VSRFEQFGFFDVSGTLAAQAIEGRLTPSSARRTVFQSEALSPLERRDLSDIFVGDSTQNSLVKAAAGIALNPFTYLMFITTPVGGKALRAFGTPFAQFGKKFSAWEREHLGLLEHLKLSTPLEGVNNVAYQESALSFGAIHREILENVQLAEEGMEQVLLDAVAKKTGKRSLDPSKYAVGSPERAVVERVQASYEIEAMGLHLRQAQDVTVLTEFEAVKLSTGESLSFEGLGSIGERQARLAKVNHGLQKKTQEELNLLTEALKDGAIDQRTFNVRKAQVFARNEQYKVDPRTFKKETRAKVFPEDGAVMIDALEHERVIADMPEIRLYAQSRAQTKNELTILNWGDEAHYKKTGEFKPDRDKVRARIQAFGNEIEGTAGTQTLQGREMIATMLGPDTVRFLKANTDPLEKTTAQIAEAYGAMENQVIDLLTERVDFSRPHVSRNVTKTARPTVGGKKVDTDQALDRALSDNPGEVMSGAGGNRAADRLSPVTEKEIFYDPDDLRRLNDAYGGRGLTDEGWAHVGAVEKEATRRFKKGDEGRQWMAVASTDANAGHHRFVEDMSLSAALYREVDDDILRPPSAPPRCRRSWCELTGRSATE